MYLAQRYIQKFGNTPNQYHQVFHTSTKELAELAARSKPKLLVLYHQLYFGSHDNADLKKEIRKLYLGNVVNGRDLTSY